MTSLASFMISSPSSIDIMPSEINSSMPKIISILSIEILASTWPAWINFLIVEGVKSVTLPNVASELSSLSMRHTLEIRGLPKKRSLFVVNLYSPTLAIVFAFLFKISSTQLERPLDLASSIRSRVMFTKSVNAYATCSSYEVLS
jgi:hypothetical protein